MSWIVLQLFEKLACIDNEAPEFMLSPKLNVSKYKIPRCPIVICGCVQLFSNVLHFSSVRLVNEGHVDSLRRAGQFVSRSKRLSRLSCVKNEKTIFKVDLTVDAILLELFHHNWVNHKIP